jgi:hypothetical protein
MSLNVCPAAIVAAPVEVVWDLLRPARLSEWADGQVDAPVPEGPAIVGQTFHITSKALGRNWHAHFTIEKLRPPRHECAGVPVATQRFRFPGEGRSALVEGRQDFSADALWHGKRF